jgi:thiol-disulfide isomerase/thioredoxin
MVSKATTIAIVAVAAAGLAAVAAIYGIGGSSGNAQAAQCEGSAARAAALDGVNVGQVAAMIPKADPEYIGDLAFKGRDGENQTLADWTGRTVLVNLWATWCVPCREEMPALQALQQAMGSDEFEVAAISIDMGDPAKPLQFYAEHKLDSLGFHHDGTMGVFNAAKKRGLAFGLPATMLVDTQGCVIGAMNGPADWASDDAKALVRRALEN